MLTTDLSTRMITTLITAFLFRPLDPILYLETLEKNQIRSDGRNLDDFREIMIIPDQINTSYGSSTIKMGNSIIMCTVDGEVVTRNPNGKFPPSVSVNTRVTPYSASKFNQGNTFRARQTIADFGALASQHIERIFNAANILPDLTMFDSAISWKLNLNLTCLNYCGNLLDVALISVMVALKSTKLPRVDYDTNTKIWSLDKEKEGVPLDLKSIIISSTFAFVGSRLFPDPNIEEEDVSNGFIHIAADSTNGNVVYIYKPSGEEVEASDLITCISKTRDRSRKVLCLINEALKRIK